MLPMDSGDYDASVVLNAPLRKMTIKECNPLANFTMRPADGMYHQIFLAKPKLALDVNRVHQVDFWRFNHFPPYTEAGSQYETSPESSQFVSYVNYVILLPPNSLIER